MGFKNIEKRIDRYPNIRSSTLHGGGGDTYVIFEAVTTAREASNRNSWKTGKLRLYCSRTTINPRTTAMCPHKKQRCEVYPRLRNYLCLRIEKQGLSAKVFQLSRRYPASANPRYHIFAVKCVTPSFALAVIHLSSKVRDPGETICLVWPDWTVLSKWSSVEEG